MPYVAPPPPPDYGPPTGSRFARYPGARGVTSRSVNGGTSGHITWTAFVTDAPQDRVVSHYKATRGAGGFDSSGPYPMFRDPPDDPVSVLSVHVAGAPGPYADVPAPPGGCVIVDSVITRFEAREHVVQWTATPPPVPVPLPVTRPQVSTFSEALQCRLPDRYETEVFVVGRLTGLLEALGHLNTHTNHGASFGFLVLDCGSDDPLEALRKRYAHFPKLGFIDIEGDWRRQARRSMDIAYGYPCATEVLNEQVEPIVDSVLERLSELFGADDVRMYALAGKNDVTMDDQTIAFVVGGSRAYVLALSWCD
jgi:hypothetical protein